MIQVNTETYDLVILILVVLSIISFVLAGFFTRFFIKQKIKNTRNILLIICLISNFILSLVIVLIYFDRYVVYDRKTQATAVLLQIRLIDTSQIQISLGGLVDPISLITYVLVNIVGCMVVGYLLMDTRTEKSNQQISSVLIIIACILVFVLSNNYVLSFVLWITIRQILNSLKRDNHEVDGINGNGEDNTKLSLHIRFKSWNFKYDSLIFLSIFFVGIINWLNGLLTFDYNTQRKVLLGLMSSVQSLNPNQLFLPGLLLLIGIYGPITNLLYDVIISKSVPKSLVLRNQIVLLLIGQLWLLKSYYYFHTIRSFTAINYTILGVLFFIFSIFIVVLVLYCVILISDQASLFAKTSLLMLIPIIISGISLASGSLFAFYMMFFNVAILFTSFGITLLFLAKTKKQRISFKYNYQNHQFVFWTKVYIIANFMGFPFLSTYWALRSSITAVNSPTIVGLIFQLFFIISYGFFIFKSIDLIDFSDYQDENSDVIDTSPSQLSNRFLFLVLYLNIVVSIWWSLGIYFQRVSVFNFEYFIGSILGVQALQPSRIASILPILTFILGFVMYRYRYRVDSLIAKSVLY